MIDKRNFAINSIVCGRAELVLRGLPDGVVDLTVTSPPYDRLRGYDGYTLSVRDLIVQLYRVTKPGGVVVWVTADQTLPAGPKRRDGITETLSSFKHAFTAAAAGFNQHDTMIWEVAGTGAKGSPLSYWQGFEYMFVWTKGRPNTVNRLRDKRNRYAGSRTTGGARMGKGGQPSRPRVISEYGVRTNVWRYAAGHDDTGDHPAPFPLALARDHILSWSNPGDLVLDPMCGSGTVPVAAIETGRDFYGIDISEDYCIGARRRIMRTQPALGV